MTMNDDIKKYPIYRIADGQYIRMYSIKSTDDYDHFRFNLHHYIKDSSYKKNEKWYKEHKIEQKLLLIPIAMHEQIHETAGQNTLTDEEFYRTYKISRWDCIFSRRYSAY